MFVIPYRLDISYTLLPITNAVMIGMTALWFIASPAGFVPREIIDAMVLRGWDPGGMLGNLFLHGGILHLVGNMIFLWVFGNAICSTIGNIEFFFLYFVLGLFADCAHLLFSGQPAIGASGAINGVVGMALVFFPKNDLDCFYGFWFGFWAKFGKFTIKTFWIVGLWFIFDIFGALFGGGHVAYWAHIGGFLAGATIGVVLLKKGVVKPFDPTIIDVLANWDTEKPTTDLDELARRANEKKKTRSMESMLNNLPDLGGPAIIPATTGETNPLEDNPIPAFRLLSIADKNDNLMLYIVNDGDAVGDVVIKPQGSLSAEIHPRELFLKKTSGWIMLHKADRTALNDLKLSISYRGGDGTQFNRLLTYQSEAKKIVLS